MRESIGASWLMMIVVAFVVLFSSFLSLSVNYSKAFKIKDGIIDRIEKANGFNCESICDIKNYMNTIGYNAKGKCAKFSEHVDDTENQYTYWGVEGNSVANKGIGENYNYCVQKVYSASYYRDSTSSWESYGVSGTYYKVEVFFKISLPIFDNLTLFNITGETTYINTPTETTSCSC